MTRTKRGKARSSRSRGVADGAAKVALMSFIEYIYVYRLEEK